MNPGKSGSAATACTRTGFHRGHQYAHQAVVHPAVARHVDGALDWQGEVVRRRHGFSADPIAACKRDLGRWCCGVFA